jgi:hypothetical protein
MKNNPVQTSTIALAGSILGLSLIGIEPAHSATFTYSGDTTGKPTWNRPNQNNNLPPTTLSTTGTAVPYDVFSFTVNTAGNYTFDNIAANFTSAGSTNDTYGILYQNAFNPAAPLTNAIIADDDDGIDVLYQFSTTLNTNTNYFLVTTGFRNTAFGTFTTTIDGPGNVSASASTSVPEPFTIIGTLVGGTAAMRMRKKLKSVNKG